MSASGSCSSGGSANKNVIGDNDFIPSDERPIFLTAAAVEGIRNALKQDGDEGQFLRVSVVGGGCSGYKYGLDFDKEERMGDIVLDFDGVKVALDPISAGYLRGTVVDYVSGLNESGFQFKNPNAKRTCGCGSSFS